MKQDEQGKYIELADFLKFLGLAPTGGQAKVLIRSGEVRVNSEVETRVRRKLRDKSVVMYKNTEFVVDFRKLS